MIRAKQSGGQQLTISVAKIEKALGLKVSQARELFERLTPRQRDVARLMAGGRTNREIAKELAISPKTLDVHRGDVYHRLKTTTAADVARIVHLVEFAAVAD